MVRDWRVPGLLLAHMALAVLAVAGFKLSALSQRPLGFWSWQAMGNLAGFAGVLALTMLLRLIPMHVAYPLTQGLAVLAVQVVAARLFFSERIAPLQWLGTLLIVAGIVVVGSRR